MDEALISALANLPEEEVVKAVLSAATRKRMADGDFAYIDAHGGRHLPIHDKDHVEKAVQLFKTTQFESQSAKAIAWRRILAAAKKFGVEVSNDDDNVSKSTPAGLFVTISKADIVHGIIYGVVNQHNLIDHQGDVVRPDELRKACWGFMKALQSGEIIGSPVDDTHEFGDIPGVIVECWMNDDDDWQIGFKPDDIEVAKAAARGDYVGWSIFGQGNRVEVIA